MTPDQKLRPTEPPNGRGSARISPNDLYAKHLDRVRCWAEAKKKRRNNRNNRRHNHKYNTRQSSRLNNSVNLIQTPISIRGMNDDLNSPT